MTRVGTYCFDARPLSLILLVATAVMFFAPGVVQAALLMFVGTCPVTAVAVLCRASRFHICGEAGERRYEEKGQALPGPYSGLVGGMFNRGR